MRASPSDMQRFRAVAVVTWLSTGGALAQEARPDAPAPSETPKQAESKTGLRPQVGVQLGYAIGNDIEGGENKGFGARLQLLARFNDFFAVGPEVALYTGAGGMTYIRPSPGGGEDSESTSALLVQFMGVARIGYDNGVFRPAFVVGPALAVAEGSTTPCVFLGAEFGFAPGRFPIVFDARYYKPLTGASGNPNYLTFGLGTRF